MIPELGHFSLIVALLLAVVQGTLPLVGAQTGNASLMAVARPAALGQLAFVALAFAALAYAFLTNDFSVKNVASNSFTQLPPVYRLTATWGSHEGSMLLWVLILALFGALVALFGNNLPARLKANVLAVQSWIAVAFVFSPPCVTNSIKPKFSSHDCLSSC